MEPNRLAVKTEFTSANLTLRSEVDVIPAEGEPFCRIRYSAASKLAGAFIVALRPFNPEGISFVYRVDVDPERRQWTINDAGTVVFDPPMERHVVSDYREGDVYSGLLQKKEKLSKTCAIGMASAAAIYRLQPDEPLTVSLNVALDKDPEALNAPAIWNPEASWEDALQGIGRLHLPDEKMKTLYDAAVRTLVLLSPQEIYPGPFYYKRFWFRDAVFIMNTLEFLLHTCFIDHAFFQDMIHSGFNMYLTLHCAQCLLRADDSRYLSLVEKVAELASPHRALARSRPPPNPGRLHGGWTACLGGSGMGYDDPHHVCG
jgi:hypothetical protein